MSSTLEVTLLYLPYPSPPTRIRDTSVTDADVVIARLLDGDPDRKGAHLLVDIGLNSPAYKGLWLFQRPVTSKAVLSLEWCNDRWRA